jgi:hypothetical protein
MISGMRCPSGSDRVSYYLWQQGYPSGNVIDN